MKIQQFHRLGKKQKEEIENLVHECFQAEKLERTLYLDNDINFYENLDSFFLMYDNEKLVSVLTIFQPLETEAEISAYTLPTERNKGHFTELLDLAEDELVGFDIVRILFVVEPGSKSGQQALKAYQAKYIKSEYLLSLDIAEWIQNKKEIYNNKMVVDCVDNIVEKTEEKNDSLLNLVQLQSYNLEATAKISATIFHTEFVESMSLLKEALASEHIESYCAYIGNEMIGIININYGVQNASIFGLGIVPEYQGKGYGKMLLELIIETIKKRQYNYITLDVGSENDRAYSLYRKEGFQIKTQYDYYEYMIELEEID